MSRRIHEVKKFYALTTYWENILYWKESEQSVVLANKFELSQIQLRGLEVVMTPRKLCNFSPLLSLFRTGGPTSPPPTTIFFPVTSTNAGISSKNFQTFIVNPFAMRI